MRGLLTGIIAGLASGLLGVSPGGFLVPIISLLLGYPQHLAQAVSLVAQVPPTSLSGVSSYAAQGKTIKMRWVVLLCCGFIAGGPLGALFTNRFTDGQLRHMFVGYLLLLVLLSVFRRSKATEGLVPEPPQPPVNGAALVMIGGIAGFSSGLLGIGGGLAITALSTVMLRMTQHRAQALSLVMTALPLTLPAAWVYVRQGQPLPWWEIAGMVAGLLAGTRLGAGVANKLPEPRLRIVFRVLIVALAVYMALS